MFYSSGTCGDVRGISESLMDGSHLLSRDVQGIGDGLLSFQRHLELFLREFCLSWVHLSIWKGLPGEALSYVPKLVLTIGVESI